MEINGVPIEDTFAEAFSMHMNRTIITAYSEEWARMEDGRWPEPRLALDGGDDGLKYYREIIPQSVNRLNKGGFIILEAAPSQFETIEKILLQNGFHNTIIYNIL